MLDQLSDEQITGHRIDAPELRASSESNGGNVAPIPAVKRSPTNKRRGFAFLATKQLGPYGST